MDFEGIGRIATNTTLAACAGALVAVAWVYPRSKKWDVGISINGLLAGLVAITCPCYWVSPTGSIAIGAIAGVDHDPRGRLHRVDPGRRPVRCVRGARRLRHLGHAQPRVVRRRQLRPGRRTGAKGLLYGGNTNQLVAQIKGSATIIVVHRSPPACC